MFKKSKDNINKTLMGFNTTNNTTKNSNGVKTRIIVLTSIIVLSLGVVLPALAQIGAEGQNKAFIEAAGLGTAPVAVVISDIIKVFLSFLGVIFIVLIVYAGFMWMTAAGAEDKITKAKTTLAAAIIGLAIILAAYAITYYAIDQIIEATKGGQGLD